MRLDSQKIRFLLALILLLAGLEIAVTLTYLARWIGLILMILGLGLLVLTAKKKPDEEIKEEKTGEKVAIEEEEPKEKRTLADSLISLLTLNGKMGVLLPVLGAFLIIFVYVFNFYLRDEFVLGVNDTLTILLGATLMLYNYIPKKFERERDFVFLFFVFMFLILVLPITLYSLIAGGPIAENTNSPFVYYLLARPTSDLLSFIGIASSAHTVPPGQFVNGINLTTSGVWIVYRNLGESTTTPYSSVGVGLSCTGLYSVSIFISGFTSFVLMEYRKFDIRVASLLTLGVFTSWLANILRMTIIVAVGSHYGSEALRWTHANLGIFIFMLWVGLFWAAMFRLLVPKEPQKGQEPEDEDSKGVSKKEESPTLKDPADVSGSKSQEA